MSDQKEYVGTGNRGTGFLLVHRWYSLGAQLPGYYASFCGSATPATSIEPDPNGRKCKRCFRSKK